MSKKLPELFQCIWRQPLHSTIFHPQRGKKRNARKNFTFQKGHLLFNYFLFPTHDTQWVGIPPRELNEKEAEPTCHLEQAIALGNTHHSL
jgi:hypothetical protein